MYMVGGKLKKPKDWTMRDSSAIYRNLLQSCLPPDISIAMLSVVVALAALEW